MSDDSQWVSAFGTVHAAILPDAAVNVSNPHEMARCIVLAHQALQTRIARLEAALREYADEKNWDRHDPMGGQEGDPCDWWCGERFVDGFTLARQTLKGIGDEL